MPDIPFSVPLMGVIRIVGDSVSITVNRAETIVSLGTATGLGKRISLEPGRTTYDIILETAREVIRRNGYNRFTAAELYAVALEKYPELKRNSFMSRVVASAPDHPSYKHYSSRRDYFSHIGTGLYWLNEKYRVNNVPTDEGLLSNHQEGTNTHI